MKRAMLFLLGLVLLCWAENAAAGENVWTSRGFIGESIWALALNPKNSQTLYVGLWMYKGVFKTTDGGITWKETNSGLTIRSLSALAVDPQDTSIVYAGFDTDTDLCKTSNGGLSWFKWSEFPTDGISDLEIDPQNPSIMYGAKGPWFLKSSDAGLTWQPIRTSFNRIGDLAIDPQNTERIYASVYEGVYVTTDDGWTWDEISDKGFCPFVIDPHNSLIRYGSYGGYSGIFKSEDGGHTWEEMTQKGLGGLGAKVIAIGSLDSSTSVICIGTDDGVFSITQSISVSVHPTTWGQIKALFR